MSHFNCSYALVIGIDAYEHGIAPLSNAVNDARAIAHLLEAKHNYKVWQLLDKDASRETIQHYLQTELPKHIQESDRLLFYFSGHGIQLSGSEGPEGYLIPQTARLGESKTYLSMHEVVQALNKLPCRHLLSVLDCCFAGSFRWSSQHRKAVVLDSEPLYREKYDRYIRDRAWQAITSAAYDQLAYDAFDLKDDRGKDTTCPQHSPFAAALLSGLAGGADMSPPATKPGQRPGDGVTTATELYQYLRDAIELSTEKRGMRQTPEICSLGKHDKGEYIFLTPGHPMNLPSAPSLNRTTNPYKGLASFEEGDSDRYFGRTTVTADLYRFFLHHQLTVVLGPSGSGKSSLVKAGLLPLVRETNQDGAEWVVLSPFRPGLSPFQALNQVLVQLGLPAVAPEKGESFEQTGTGKQALNKRTLCKTLSPAAALKKWFDQHSNHLLIVIDQFEELITQCSDRERQQFLETLAIALETYPERLHAVITLRSDFESQFQSSALGPRWKESRFQVSALSRQELRQTIEEPAALRVLFFDPPDLVERLIDEVVNMPGGLPLLSFALSELYLSYLNRQEIASKQGHAIERAITKEDYSALGGVTLALIRRAEAEYQQLTKTDTAYAHTIQQVMLRMVALEADGLARRPLLSSEQRFLEPENSRVQTVITQFLAARLLVAGKTTDEESFVEPAHDALVRGWPRLSQWLKEKEIQETVLLIRALTSVANQWATSTKKKDSRGLLWKEDPRLPQAVQIMSGASGTTSRSGFARWLCQDITAKLSFRRKRFWESVGQSTWLNSREDQFVKDSLERRYRARRNLCSAVTITVIALSGLAILAEIGRKAAEENTKIAEQERNRAKEQTLLARNAEQISNIRGQAARSLSWTSTARASEGLALSINSLKESVRHPQHPQVQFDASSALLTAVQNTREQNRLYGHEGSARVAIYSPDGQYIASGGTDNYLTLWNAQTGQQIWRRKTADWIFTAAFSPDSQRIVSAGRDPDLRLWNAKTGEPIGKALVGHDEAVRAVAFSSDGDKIASGSDDKTLRIWNVNSDRPLETTRAHGGSVQAVSFGSYGSDGEQIASGSTDGIIRLWNADTGQQIGDFKGRQGAIFALDFNSDGTRLISGGSDRTIRLWNVGKREQIGESFKGHEDQVYAVRFTPDNQHFASAGADRSIRLWHAESGRLTGEILDAHSDIVRSIDISSNSNQIVSSSSDRSIRQWDIRLTAPTGQPLVSNHTKTILSIAINAESNRLVSADEGGNVQLWSIEDNQKSVTRLGKHDGQAYSVAISPNGQWIASGGGDGTLRLWNIETKEEILFPTGHSGSAIYSVAFSPDSQRLVSSGAKGQLKVWNALSGEFLYALPTTNQLAIYAVAFSPVDNGRYIVSGSQDDTLTIWDTRTRESHRVLSGHTDDVWTAAFSHDGQTIASGSKDRSIILWDTQTGGQIKQLTGHNNTVWSVQFNPADNNLLVSGSYDRTVRLWNVEKKQQIGPPLTGHTGSVWSVLFTSKGDRILTAGADLSLRIWPTYWHEWPKMACDRLQYHPILTQPERFFEQTSQGGQESVEMAKNAKLACDQAFWRDLQP